MMRMRYSILICVVSAVSIFGWPPLALGCDDGYPGPEDPTTTYYNDPIPSVYLFQATDGSNPGGVHNMPVEGGTMYLSWYSGGTNWGAYGVDTWIVTDLFSFWGWHYWATDDYDSYSYSNDPNTKYLYQVGYSCWNWYKHYPDIIPNKYEYTGFSREDNDSGAVYDGNVTANGTIELVRVFANLSNPYIPVYKKTDTLSINSSILKSQPPSTTYHWNTSDPSSAYIDGPDNQTTVNIKFNNYGKFTATQTATFPRYSWENPSPPQSASGTSNHFYCANARILEPYDVWLCHQDDPPFRYMYQFVKEHPNPLKVELLGSIVPYPDITYLWSVYNSSKLYIKPEDLTKPYIFADILDSGSTDVNLNGVYNGETLSNISAERRIEIYDTHLDRDTYNEFKLKDPNNKADPYNCGGACLHAYNGTLLFTTEPPFPQPTPAPKIIYKNYPRKELDTSDLAKGDVIRYMGDGICHLATITDGTGMVWEYNGPCNHDNWGYSTISNSMQTWHYPYVLDRIELFKKY